MQDEQGLRRFAAVRLLAVALLGLAPHAIAAPPGPSLHGIPRGEDFRVLWMHELSGEPRSLTFREQLEVERHRLWREEVSFVSPSDGEAEFMEKVLDSINDPGDVLNDELKGKLREAIARHYVVRSLPTPDAYLDEIDRNPYFQPHPEPHHDPQTRTFYRLYEDWPAAPELPWPEFVEDVWRARTKWRLIPDGFGTGDAGSLVVVRRIRDRQEFDGNRALRDPSVRDRDWWAVSAARGPMQLVKPTSGIEAVLERDGEALVAECHLIVRYPEELVGNWVTRWYYDPETETWSVYITTVFSLRSVYVIR